MSFRFCFNKPLRKKKVKALQLYSSFKAEALLPFFNPNTLYVFTQTWFLSEDK